MPLILPIIFRLSGIQARVLLKRTFSHTALLMYGPLATHSYVRT